MSLTATTDAHFLDPDLDVSIITDDWLPTHASFRTPVRVEAVPRNA